MDISVIIISYNEAEYLTHSVLSVLEQQIDWYRSEIIIADDGSEDDSISIIESLEKQYPNTIKHFISDRSDGVVIPSIRVSNNIKKAISLAKGKYIAVLSADDNYCSNLVLKESFDFLEKKSSEKYSAAFMDYRVSYGKDEKDKIDVKFNNFPFRKLMVAKNYTHISTFVFRRDVFEKNLLLDRFCDDTGMLFSICIAGKIKHMDFVGFEYFQRNESIMHSSDILELNILEILLFQDFINCGKFRVCARAREYHSLKKVFQHRNKLKNKKYKKYLESGRMYKNDVLGMINAYNDLSFFSKLKFKIILWRAWISHVCFGTARVIGRKVYLLTRAN